jgi:hypothetical protein
MTGKHSDIHRAHELKGRIEQIIAGIDKRAYADDIRIAYTGGIEDFIEEHAALIADLALSTIVVILLVTLSMYFFFHDWVATASLLIALGMGTMWTFGIAYFAVGYLNANSAFLGSIVIGARTQRLHLDQLAVEFVHQRRRLQGVIRALLAHAGHRQTPELGIKQLYQLTRSSRVAGAKRSHEPRNGIGLQLHVHLVVAKNSF